MWYLMRTLYTACILHSQKIQYHFWKLAKKEAECLFSLVLIKQKTINNNKNPRCSRSSWSRWVAPLRNQARHENKSWLTARSKAQDLNQRGGGFMMTSWWLNHPFEKIFIGQIGSWIPHFRGNKLKNNNLKPSPRWGTPDCKKWVDH